MLSIRCDGLIVCCDVGYRPQSSVAAGVAFRSWTDAKAAESWTSVLPAAEPYQPGEFFRRELPCLLALLQGRSPKIVVIDGNVWLDSSGSWGLGAHLHHALGGASIVVGVAKTAFRGSLFAVPVLRGESQNPLYVTAAGASAEEAASWVKSMHGSFRIPTLIKLADRLSRNS